MNWKCPICGELLMAQASGISCSNHHSFDKAKEGYVNLLPVQFKKSKEPGDNKAMINARRDFLTKGHYQLIASAIADAFETHLTSSDTVHIHDLGCGEGYYLDVIAHKLGQGLSNSTFSGNDISKVAVQRAAKRYSNYDFCVASSFQLPIPSQQLSGVLQMFAPVSPDEIARVLEQQGIWVSVEPGAKHLQELKKAIYQRPENNQSAIFELEGFDILSSSSVSFAMELLDRKDRLSLLMMTPYYWKVHDNKREQVLDEISTLTTDFTITVYQKRL